MKYSCRLPEWMMIKSIVKNAMWYALLCAGVILQEPPAHASMPTNSKNECSLDQNTFAWHILRSSSKPGMHAYSNPLPPAKPILAIELLFALRSSAIFAVFSALLLALASTIVRLSSALAW